MCLQSSHVTASYSSSRISSTVVRVKNKCTDVIKKKNILFLPKPAIKLSFNLSVQKSLITSYMYVLRALVACHVVAKKCSYTTDVLARASSLYLSVMASGNITQISGTSSGLDTPPPLFDSQDPDDDIVTKQSLEKTNKRQLLVFALDMCSAM